MPQTGIECQQAGHGYDEGGRARRNAAARRRPTRKATMKMLTLNAGSWLTRTKWLPPAALAALATVAITAGKANAQRNVATACTGTYFITEDSGSVNLWTLHRDGTLVNTSLGERAFNFSTQHGSWEQV